jgi:hypothetical protein
MRNVLALQRMAIAPRTGEDTAYTSWATIGCSPPEPEQPEQPDPGPTCSFATTDCL